MIALDSNVLLQLAFSHGKGDLADYLIRERAREAGCTEVATFDRALLKEDGFRAP